MSADPYDNMPRLPAELWSKMRHVDQLITVRLKDGRIVRKLVISANGAIVGIEVAGYSGVDPTAVTFQPSEIASVKRTDTVLDLLGLSPWISPGT
jgi:hypothetical protein